MKINDMVKRSIINVIGNRRLTERGTEIPFYLNQVQT